MKKVILDTNFILNCIKYKIDFFEQIPLMGFQIIIPQEVLSEIIRLKKTKVEANVAFALIDKNPNEFERLTFGKGHVDNKIIEYINEHDDVGVATMDKDMRERLYQENKKVIVIRGMKKLEVI